MKRKLLLVLVMCLAMCGTRAGSLEAKLYIYQDLTLHGLPLNGGGSTPAHINAINDSGWIVGSYCPDFYQPFVWRPGLGMTTLQMGPSNVRGEAHGVNNAGQIVGEVFLSAVTGMGHWPILWLDPSQAPTLLNGFYAWEPSPYPDTDTPARGINDSGQIAGDMFFDIAAHLHGARWVTPPQMPIDLVTLGGDTSSGRGINNANQVAGTATTALGQNRACLWVPGQPPKGDLVTLPQYGYFSYGNAINNQGNVVGKADLTPGLGTGHAFFWNHNTGVAEDICPQDYESDPAGISDANEVVGYVGPNTPKSQVFFWTPSGGLKDLNKLVVNLPAGVTLQNVKAISRNGRYITGFDSNWHPYLLTATGMPPYSLLLLE
jgi:uncharacterized membrane protein